jgi:hypothetical protein
MSASDPKAEHPRRYFQNDGADCYHPCADLLGSAMNVRWPRGRTFLLIDKFDYDTRNDEIRTLLKVGDRQ